jgi:GntR family transcriptional regulator
MKTLASPSFRPLYDQIKILITQSLIAGEWRPGESIPSEIELANRFQVSQGTVRKAIDALATENILVRRQGKGTFVASHAQERSTTRFLRVAPDSAVAEYPASELLSVERARAPEATLKLLDLRAGAAVYIIRRLLRYRAEPAILDEIHLPCATFKGLDEETLRKHKGSMYGFLESQYGVTMIRAEERIKAVAADDFSAGLLAVAAGTPLLRVDRIAFTYGDRPVEWRRGLCLTEECSYINEIT